MFASGGCRNRDGPPAGTGVRAAKGIASGGAISICPAKHGMFARADGLGCIRRAAAAGQTSAIRPKKSSASDIFAAARHAAAASTGTSAVCRASDPFECAETASGEVACALNRWSELDHCQHTCLGGIAYACGPHDNSALSSSDGSHSRQMALRKRKAQSAFMSVPGLSRFVSGHKA